MNKPDEGEKMKTETVSQLLAGGHLAFAREPRDNPDNLRFSRYALTPIEHDYPGKSPAMWNAAYRKFGFDAGYIFLVGEPQNAQEILGAFQNDPKYIGGGAGVGFKDEAVKYIGLDPMAEAIGAINFIMKMPDGSLRGYNTDGLGYAMGLAERFTARGDDLYGKKAVMLGAGGTGNAIAFALAERGMTVTILNRTVKKAEELAARVNRFMGIQLASFGGEENIPDEILKADAIINVSTKGSSGEMAEYSALAPATLPATPENVNKNLTETRRLLGLVPKKTIVSDVVLTKEPTPFLRVASELGFETLDGVPMVVNQGVEAFWLLHGQDLTWNGVKKEDLAAVMKEAASQK